MQIQSGTEVQHHIRKCLLQYVQLTRHVVFRMRRSKQQGRNYDDPPGAGSYTRLYCLCQGGASKFQVAVIQSMSPYTLAHQGHKLLEFPDAIRISTPMAS